ncbi:MAG: SNF2 family DNA or RNA helicase [Phenylobacterium sp.]
MFNQSQQEYLPLLNIIHGFWLPESDDQFIQSGQFWLWVETSTPQERDEQTHPCHLSGSTLSSFLNAELQLTTASLAYHQILLPTRCNSLSSTVLPSPELKHFPNQDDDDDAKVSLQPWRVECVALDMPIQQLSQLHFLATYQQLDTGLGSDFLFWHYFSQTVKQLMLKDHYLPGLIQRASKKKQDIYRSWQIVSADYEASLERAVKHMPLICKVAFEAKSLLRHFTEVNLHQLLELAISKAPVSVKKPFDDTLIEGFFAPVKQPGSMSNHKAEFAQWHQWQHKIADMAQNAHIQLCFQLVEGEQDNWSIAFLAASKHDLSFKQSLADYWRLNTSQKAGLTALLGDDFEHQVLCALGGAASIYPRLWQGMNSQQPERLILTLEQAFEFLKETAWVLEDAGYKVIVPAWWTPQGRQRAKVKLRTKSAGTSASSADSSKGLLSLDNLIDYRYELAIGDQPVTEQEWSQLVNAKTPLVEFRGQWMELDQAQMADMLAFWRKQNGDEDKTPLSMPELLQQLADENGIFELNQNDALAQMLGKLSNQSMLEPIDDPAQLNASLRDYQKRGVSWLRYLEQLGLNGCLADDMGLGKTIQVIATLVVDEAQGVNHGCTLLIAPTSVMGNWQKEVQKFAPQLNTAIHHGSGRIKDQAEFVELCHNNHMVITSYSLARKDAKLLENVHWQRIVLDEAQNIKNPKSAQSKAIFKLKGVSKLALTGTPVENRLMDLWSIFNFLNPGYLSSQANFRKQYELPIQRHNSVSQSTLLKKLIAPFILRRLKTDKNIIKDLPDKVENKVYCNLSKEQAALYEAVVLDVEKQLAEQEEMDDKSKIGGLMLSTLTKLKQICNHPMQFLQDGSEFTPQRAHKLERLGEMLEEAQAEGDSVLIFTQFTEIGEQLVKYLSQQKQLNCYYLHGGVSRKKRESMIEEFQDANTGPSVFVLSLKAGGVGITLTRANHVFHFDRWWNPAVEDQATDRAFRIGQKKNVFVHKFITLGTLEERIDEMISDKKKMAGAIVGSDESWLSNLDTNAFKSLIALNKQSVL